MNKKLLNPKSIVVVGGSNHVQKPGGKVLKNLIQGNYKGKLSVVNRNETEVQGVVSYPNVEAIGKVDLAILTIPAKFCVDAVNTLVNEKSVKAIIIISAGFGEETKEGGEIEQKLNEIVSAKNVTLIGPNCIGVITEKYKGVFTTPIPEFDKNGCDLISSSGATAVFIMEAGLERGLRFANVFSVGNSIQTGVEEVLEYMDENYDSYKSSKIKLLYVEDIKNPVKFYIHASSLVNKGCKIAAIKSGVSAAGSRAASSHTGALATSDQIIRALFRKSGVVYCSGRNELITIASVFNYQKLSGLNIGIITHAGGSAVMLTDVLSTNGLEVPEITSSKKTELLTKLNPGSSVSNPIDFLATGTAIQLGEIIDYCDKYFDEIDAMVVVFGSPGLFNVQDVYKVLNAKMKTSKKPIFPVLPSIVNAEKEIHEFVAHGKPNFPDEVQFGKALCEIYYTPKPIIYSKNKRVELNVKEIRSLLENVKSGYLSPEMVAKLLLLAGVPIVEEKYASSIKESLALAEQLGFPLVMKVVGPLHKTESNGVSLNVSNINQVEAEYNRLMSINEATKVLMQPMLKGIELFIGAKYEKNYGHLILFGLGGIFVEILKDFASGLAPLTVKEIQRMLKQLKGYKLIEGYRGQEGIDEAALIDVIHRISYLVNVAPEITELDLNPLIGNKNQLMAVDARIRIN